MIFSTGTAHATAINTTNNSSDVQAQLIDSDIPFIENEGQADSSVDYYANTLYGKTYVTSDGVTHVVGVNETYYTVLEEQFLDENGNSISISSQGENQSSATVNYYIGSDSSKWYTNISTYNEVSLGEIYPYITVELKATGGSVEKLFYLEPGADINDIIIQILGANSLEILDDGSLAINTDNGTITMTTPKAYQDNETVNVAYQILSNNTYSFTVTNYDTTKTLTIDPTLQYSTYLGGTGNDYGYDVAVDEDGNIYITGQTGSSDFPTVDAYQNGLKGYSDAFVSVFNSSGNLKYSTYLGGTGDDAGIAIAVDESGCVYITGQTGSSDFPLENAYQSSPRGLFVTKLNSNGDGLIYSTYFGGTGYTYVHDIAVDSSGCAYITGESWSHLPWPYSYLTDFPTTEDCFQANPGDSSLDDAFVSKFSSLGDLIYSTLLGGDNYDIGWAIAVDDNGNIYVTGRTSSSNFPTVDAYQTSLKGYSDAFVSVFNSSGELTYSTYLGGNDTYYSDSAQGIAVDEDGNIIITGYTDSTDFPVTSNAYQTSLKGYSDAFVSVFNSSGELTYSTYLGGTGNDYGYDVAVDDNGNIYVTGWTYVSDFPVTPNAYQATNHGNNDAFVSVFNSSGDLIYSTYLGGTYADYSYGIGVDEDGNIIITGYTDSTDFPVISDAYQDTNKGDYDVFVAKFSRINTNIVVSDLTGKTGGTVNLTATLTDSNGTPLNGKEIIFTVNGVDYSGSTDEYGVATVGYLIDLASGQYGIKATFDGDIDYYGNENTGTLTVDNDAPVIVSTDPVNGATSVDSSSDITIIFSEDIIEGTDWIEMVNSSGEAIPFTTSIDDNVLTIKPTNDLAESKYKLILHTGSVTDLAGNLLAGKSIRFSVGTSPTITATSPVNGATNVNPAKTIAVTFSEAIRKSSNFWVELVNLTTGEAVDYTSYITGGNILVINPVDDLVEATYKVVLHTGCVTDLAGNLIAGQSFRFTVGTSPTITSTNPVDGATNVNVAKTITITFSENIKKSSKFWIELIDSNGNTVAYTSYITSGNILVIDPTVNLAANTTYKIKLHTGCVTDLAGNPLAAKIITFTTRST